MLKSNDKIVLDFRIGDLYYSGSFYGYIIDMKVISSDDIELTLFTLGGLIKTLITGGSSLHKEEEDFNFLRTK